MNEGKNPESKLICFNNEMAAIELGLNLQPFPGYKTLGYLSSLDTLFKELFQKNSIPKFPNLSPRELLQPSNNSELVLFANTDNGDINYNNANQGVEVTIIEINTHIPYHGRKVWSFCYENENHWVYYNAETKGLTKFDPSQKY